VAAAIGVIDATDISVHSCSFSNLTQTDKAEGHLQIALTVLCKLLVLKHIFQARVRISPSSSCVSPFPTSFNTT
jgi:hypothetical protein